jgi:hypothetical protein
MTDNLIGASHNTYSSRSLRASQEQNGAMQQRLTVVDQSKINY